MKRTFATSGHLIQTDEVFASGRLIGSMNAFRPQLLPPPTILPSVGCLTSLCPLQALRYLENEEVEAQVRSLSRNTESRP